MVLSDGVLHIGEGLSSKPVSDLEFHPSLEDYPRCYVRLSSEASIRDDTIPKETIYTNTLKLKELKLRR